MSYTLRQVAEMIGAQSYGVADVAIEWLLTDSRSLAFPETTLFFALRTRTGDGHRYLDDLYRRGVRAFVVGTLPQDFGTQYPETAFLLVPSPLRALQDLAEAHRRRFDIPVVGVTGSNGKTIVKEWIYQLLIPSMKAVRSPRSYNSQVGVPLSVWLLNERSRVGIFEAGISQPREMSALRHIIRPTIGVMTYLGPAHQENFSTIEEKCLEKLKLFKESHTLVYNADDEVLVRCLAQSAFRGKGLGWSRKDKDAPLFVEVETDAHTATLHYHFVAEGVKAAEGSFELPFTDEASIENAIHAAAVGFLLGLTPADLAERMPRLQAVAMRLEVKPGVRGLTLINDAYNSDLASIDIALDFLSRRREGKAATVILSDVQQTGLPAEELYRQVAARLAHRKINRLIGIGPAIRAAAMMFEGEKEFFDTTQDLLKSGRLESLADEVVLLKGARQFRFELIAEDLQLKVHETTLEVNLEAMAENLRYYRSFMRPETKLVCMVKAGAYGSGSVEVARTLQDLGVDYLAVAVADEGAELRKAGITAGIIIMNPEMSAFHTLFKYGLQPEVYNFRLLDALIAAARQEGISNFPVHLKLDTGMCRLGFHPENDLDALIERLQGQQAVSPRSVFSHFVGSDSPDFDEFSAQQFERFDRASLRLQEAFPHRVLRHICNSAAIERFPERHLDMCRLGLGLYGVNPIDNGILTNVATLRTTILQIREVEAGTSVGYSRRTIVDRPSRIAAIPIGYADGLNRRLGNGRAACWVNGHLAPYVGNICMDVCMIDVTDVPCREGDRVEIFGDHLSVSNLAQRLETIPYEILTAVSQRVKRVYYQ